MIRKYKHKGTGKTVHAVKLTTSLLKDIETLSKLPTNFKVFNRVTPTGRFAYHGTRGHLGQWFIYPSINDRSWFIPETQLMNNFDELEVAPPKPPKPDKKGMGFRPIELQPEAPHNNALEFEMAIKQTIAEQMAKGLTVTEAVGTLQLCSMDIANQFFNNTTIE